MEEIARGGRNSPDIWSWALVAELWKSPVRTVVSQPRDSFLSGEVHAEDGGGVNRKSKSVYLRLHHLKVQLSETSHARASHASLFTSIET